MQFRELIDELAKKLQVKDGIEIDGDNRCFMEFDGMGVVIQGLDEASQVAFLSDIGEPPPERLTDLYRTMLEANHLFQGTCGATISVEPGTGKVHLCKCLPYVALDGDAFVNELGNFMNVVETWRKLVTEFRASSETVRSNLDEGAQSSPLDSFMRV